MNDLDLETLPDDVKAAIRTGAREVIIDGQTYKLTSCLDIQVKGIDGNIREV